MGGVILGTIQLGKSVWSRVERARRLRDAEKQCDGPGEIDEAGALPNHDTNVDPT